MKWLEKLRRRAEGFTNSVARYPLTAALLAAAAVLISVQIHSAARYPAALSSLAVGAALSACAQAAFERFGEKRPLRRAGLLAGSAVLTAGYYVLALRDEAFGPELEIRTAVVLLALGIAYVWVPVIRSRVSFNESYMAAFKAFFHALLYAAVLMGGCSLILMAIGRLIYPISDRAYSYAADLIFALFAPIFFLSLIPVYPGKERQSTTGEMAEGGGEWADEATRCPRFLEVLISYIVIPLTAIFTVILVLYIVRNIGGAFWTNSLLEPMLVSYAVVVIEVLILSSRLENPLARLFQTVFPKVLVPIVVFQIASSLLRIREEGFTHPRYFVILFGVFAVLSGGIMSVARERRNGAVAALLIVLSAISVIPPVDAFTVSRASQTGALVTTLEKNGMLQNSVLTPKGDLPDGDKEKIVRAVEYLDEMGYIKSIPWIPPDFVTYRDFYDTFGFAPSELPSDKFRYVNVSLEETAALDIEGYDAFARTTVSRSGGYGTKTLCTIRRPDGDFRLVGEQVDAHEELALLDPDGRELVRFNTEEIFRRYQGYGASTSVLSAEDATFTAENGGAAMAVVVQYANLSTQAEQTDGTADVYVLMRISS